MTRDERLYPDPEIFRPERFLGHPHTEDKAFNPWNYTFGTGKRYQSILPREFACGVFTEPRKCPGVYLIQSSLWLVIARVVATFDIAEEVADGVPVKVNVRDKNPFFRYLYSKSRVKKASFLTNLFHWQDLRWS